MTSPLADATAAHFGALQALPPRQRLDGALAQLPNAGGISVGTAEGATGNDSISLDSLVEPVARINEAMRAFGLEFDISEVTDRPITRIVDRENGEVIRQIPAEEVLRIAEHMEERMEELKGRLIQLEA